MTGERGMLFRKKVAKYSLQTFLITVFFLKFAFKPQWPLGVPLSQGGEQYRSAAFSLGQA